MTNIRIYFNTLLIIFTASVLFSCKADDVVSGDDNPNVSLTLYLGDKPQFAKTRSVADPVLNENKIKSVDVFLYKKDAAEDAEPVFFSTDIILNEVAAGTANINVSVPYTQYSELFPTDGNTQCEAYVIVNRRTATSGANDLPVSKSRKSLKESTILYAPEFSSLYEDPITHFYHPTKQEDFVMHGEKTVTRTGLALTGTIPVERVSAKISLIIQGIADEVIADGKKWKYVEGSARISLRRAVTRTYLGMSPQTGEGENIYTAKKDDIFSLEAISILKDITTYKTTEVPFYTYPTFWKNDENTRTHFMLTVTWQQIADDNSNIGSPVTTYYQININPAGSYISPNNHYKISQKIEVLGSTEPEKPVTLYPCSYIVLDWGNTMIGDEGTNSNANLSRFRYLVVDQPNIRMDNTTSEEVFFFSSDPVKISEVKVRWVNTQGETVDTVTFVNRTGLETPEIDADGYLSYTIKNTAAVGGVTNRVQGDYKLTLKVHNADATDPDDKSYIFLEHKLNNSMSANGDFTEYYIDLKVEHIDNPSYYENIYITQYPMIFIRADINTDWTNGGGQDDYNGFVKVNNQNGNNSKDNIYGNTNGIGTGTNQNPNRYIITVSSLPDTDEGKKFMVGDPRVLGVDNLGLDNLNTTKTRPTMQYTGDTSDRKIKYYHPTDESEAKSSVISPQFMIASSYGKTNSQSRTVHERRCATYQEDGYPAGRWRIPTQAEIEYIVGLSAIGVIPVLFGTPGDNGYTYYWSANGAVGVSPGQQKTQSSSTQTSAYVRCVYDTWYWTDKCDKNEFTWGDKENL